jgi:hypothetical protein
MTPNRRKLDELQSGSKAMPTQASGERHGASRVLLQGDAF